MALGDLTKQLAEQAIRNVGTAAPAAPETLSNVIIGQVQAMQKALKEDEELLVLFHTGAEMLRVLEFFLPGQQVAVLTGVDRERNLTRAITPIESLRLVCKVVKVPHPAKPTRVVFKVPKS